MLTTLLPVRIAPIIRSRMSSRWPTRRAPRWPDFSSRNSHARDTAVSDVSLAEKNAETTRHRTIAASDSQCSSDMAQACLIELLSQEGTHLGRIDIARDKGGADRARQDKRQLAA